MVNGQSSFIRKYEVRSGDLAISKSVIWRIDDLREYDFVNWRFGEVSDCADLTHHQITRSYFLLSIPSPHHKITKSHFLRAPLLPSASAGFTLLEMILVLFLLGAMLSMVVPRLVYGDPLSRSTRQFLGTLQEIQTRALRTQKTWRLYLNFDQPGYWTTVIEGQEERVPSDPALGSRTILPSSIRFLDARTLSRGRVEFGTVALDFLPLGQPDLESIELTDDRQNVMAILVHPLTRTIQVIAGRQEDRTPEPIPERLRAYLQPSTPSPVRSGLKL
jgi:type II secretory pathway pseudopilin PulG